MPHCQKISTVLKLSNVQIDLIFSFFETAAYLGRKFLTVAARWHLCAFKMKASSSVMTLIGEWASLFFYKKKKSTDHHLNIIVKHNPHESERRVFSSAMLSHEDETK